MQHTAPQVKIKILTLLQYSTSVVGAETAILTLYRNAPAVDYGVDAALVLLGHHGVFGNLRFVRIDGHVTDRNPLEYQLSMLKRMVLTGFTCKPIIEIQQVTLVTV